MNKDIEEVRRGLKLDVVRSFARWNQIAMNGSGDPFWPDGTNMNLVRNHIIWYYRKLDELEENLQLSMFDVPDTRRRPLPPVVPNNYMVIGGNHGKAAESNKDLVWGHPGEYKA